MPINRSRNKSKQQIKINNQASLESLMQETYNDACLQLTTVQLSVNELVAGTTLETVDDHTKVAKEKGNLLKLKESAIKIKLEIAKLQNDILKNADSIEESGESNYVSGTATMDDFEAIREMLKEKKE